MNKLDLQGQPLDLGLTLACGQAFRWREVETGLWRGVVRDKLIELAMEPNTLLWRTFPQSDEMLVRDYLRLGDDVTGIYAELAEMDPYVGELTRRFYGMRLLRQDPTETLLSFVCSAANSIPRISAAVEAIAVLYGELVCEHRDTCYYAFPQAGKLAEANSIVLADTQSLGFRGRKVKLVARQVVEHEEEWLMSLRCVSYAQAHQALLGMHGVGRKIADCVCLFSLDMDEAVPVDTHVRQLAQRLWMPEVGGKTVTDAVYRQVVQAFAERYGRLAGWAQQFLFYDDLLR